MDDHCFGDLRTPLAIDVFQCATLREIGAGLATAILAGWDPEGHSNAFALRGPLRKNELYQWPRTHHVSPGLPQVQD